MPVDARDSVWESVLSPHCVGSGDLIEVFRIGTKHLYQMRDLARTYFYSYMGGVTREREHRCMCALIMQWRSEVSLGSWVSPLSLCLLLLCSAFQARGPVSFWVISPSLPPISRSAGVTDVWSHLSFYVGLVINLDLQACMRSTFTHRANSLALPPWVWRSGVPH